MPDPSVSDRLDQAVAEFLAALETGDPPGRDELLARYADVADDLARFLADHDRMAGLAAPVRQIIGPALASWRRAAGNTPRRPGGTDVTLTHDGPAAAAERYARDELQPASGHERRLLGDYEILRELGRGGMGVVYQARHVQLNRIVALKMVLAGQFADAEDLARFREEARAAAALDHSGIVSIFESGQCQGQPFFSMAFVEGPNLANVLQSGPLAPQIAARLLLKVATAAAYAHARGVIHRDLKPANILLAVPTGRKLTGPELLETCEPKITDFGLAKRLDGDSRLTSSNQLLGTPAYMSPEQAAGRIRETGAAADIYSLGAILYTMLTGRPPFVSDGNPVDVLLQVLEREPALPRKLRPEIPVELEWICLKCLEKQPADRYAAAADLAADLDRYLRHEPVEARSPTLGQRFRRWMRRQPVLAGHVIGVGIPLLLTQLIFVVHPQRDLRYHLELSGVLVAWLVVSLICQWLAGREGEPRWAWYVWSAADAILLTALLSLIASPLGPLLSAYLVMVCASALFFQTRLVIFTTAAALLSYGGLLLLRPSEAQPWHYSCLFAAILITTGFAVGYQVWRLSILRDYYDDRRGR
jgi:serine/threonine-protein kinase